MASQLAEHTSMLLGERLARFAYSRDGGNAAQGEVLFRSHVQVQCSRCHKIGRRGSEIGPELTNIAAQRDADYLLRSILSPGRIDPEVSQPNDFARLRSDPQGRHPESGY